MSDFISLVISFLTSLSELDIFQYFIGSVAVFGVVLLVRKIIYA